MAEQEACPICRVGLITNAKTGDLDCPECKRAWYPFVVDGEPSLASRRRSVRVDFRELREGGDMQKAIRPA